MIGKGLRNVFAFVLGLSATSLSQAAEGVQVVTAAGPVTGSESQGIRAFLGIPYAAAPVGEWRWQPPRPMPAWTQPRDATKSGAACPQGIDTLYGLTPREQDEDCLFLNVWTPSKTAGSLPVMVWLHGGGHRMGSGSLANYDGTRLASRGVVVVTLNYRLGYFGYFAHPAAGSDGGNFGLMDQIAALQWVRQNIAAFGGDPGRVTIFGQSAGGADVLTLMTSAPARGLFQAAIVESGGGWAKPLTRDAMAAKVADAFGKAGIDAHDAKSLRALDPKQIVAASDGDHALGFGPFLDGVTLTEAPWEAFAAGREAKVPLMIGTTDFEQSLMKVRVTGEAGGMLANSPAAAGWYSGRAKDASERTPLLFRDGVFTAPARWIAAQHQKLAPTWLYRFSYVTSGRREQVAGAGHAAEIAYVFDTLDALKSFGVAVNDEDRAMASRLADCWSAFAKAGKPDCGTAWKIYDPAADNVLMIGRDVGEARIPDAPAMEGLTKLLGPEGWLAR